MLNNERIDKARERMISEGYSALLISSREDIKYFTGIDLHSGERLSAFMLLEDKLVLVINKLFPQKPLEGIYIKYYDDVENPIAYISSLLETGNCIGIDKNLQSHFLLKFMKMRSDLKYENGSLVVDRVRMVKNPDEVLKMIAASKKNDEAMHAVVQFIEQAVKSERTLTECDVANQIGIINKAEGVSFEPIVCFGKGGASPHHESDDTALSLNESILIDMGGIRDGYCSDMTRSFYFGEATPRYKEIYEIVREANEKAIQKVAPGVKLSEIDAAARNHIKACGYGDYFTHRTGHGIGTEVHEFPDVSAISEVVCEVGMCFSIEPGIYLPDEFGVRIEDLVCVTDDGCKVLNEFPKNLIEITR